jgi:carboxyl-terminal processing protease
VNPKRSQRSALALVVSLSITACGGGGTPTQPTPSLSPRGYLDEVIGVMQANSINRLTIDWNMFRASVVAQAAGMQTISDTYPAIRIALGLLGDGHSTYRAANGAVIFVANRSCSPSGAATPAVPPTIGYVKVGSFSGSGVEAAAFANGIQGAIQTADRDDLIGWIVDVRGNGGGNI